MVVILAILGEHTVINCHNTLQLWACYFNVLGGVTPN